MADEMNSSAKCDPKQIEFSKNEQLFLWNAGLLSQSSISNDRRNLE